MRILIKKGTFTKGYEITFSKEVYTIQSVLHSKATLDDGQVHSFSQLQKIPEGTTMIKGGKKEMADKASRVDRLMRREGIL